MGDLTRALPSARQVVEVVALLAVGLCAQVLARRALDDAERRIAPGVRGSASLDVANRLSLRDLAEAALQRRDVAVLVRACGLHLSGSGHRAHRLRVAVC